MQPDGWFAGLRRVESPNHDARPDGSAIELLVIHSISLPPGVFGGGAIDALFTNRLDFAAHPYYDGLRGVKVSAHFLIDRAGAATQFVSCRERAWHAGASQWEGRTRCNDFSIGVELEGSEFEPFTDGQYRSLARLQQALRRVFALRAARGHSEIAPDRKHDPGPLFDWRRVARDM